MSSSFANYDFLDLMADIYSNLPMEYCGRIDHNVVNPSLGVGCLVQITVDGIPVGPQIPTGREGPIMKVLSDPEDQGLLAQKVARAILNSSTPESEPEDGTEPETQLTD